MGGMDNETSVTLAQAKQKSREYHAKKNERLYKEYSLSNDRFKISFSEWKDSQKRVQKSKNERMQKPLSDKELKKRGYSTKSLNQTCRWK